MGMMATLVGSGKQTLGWPLTKTTSTSGPSLPHSPSPVSHCLGAHRLPCARARRTGSSPRPLLSGRPVRKVLKDGSCHSESGTMKGQRTAVHQEKDSAITAIFQDQHFECSFFHFVSDQLSPTLETMAPRSGGFSKRFTLSLCSFRPRYDPLQEMRFSKIFLIDYVTIGSRSVRWGLTRRRRRASRPVLMKTSTRASFPLLMRSQCLVWLTVTQVFTAIGEAMSEEQEELEAEEVHVNLFFK